MYRLKNEPSTSSREKPQPIWVRSLVPNEKNSATCAIWPAVSAARGTSIIVPISVCTLVPVSAATSASTRSVSSRATSSSCTAPTSGIMISGCGSPPAATRSAAACAIARTCIAYRPGTTSPSRTPRRPSIGFSSCSRRTASSSLRSLSVASSPASAILTVSSVRSGRNSCSGGSSSLMVTGLPSMAARISTKSPRCSGSSASSAAFLVASSSARIMFSTSCLRSPRNMCSVLVRPMP